jgi:hypothetical protein
MPTIDNQALYEKAKAIADQKYAKPSAYKSGFLVKLYKQMGGTYSGKKTKELTNQIAEIQGGAISKATKTRARTALRKSGQDYSEEDVERKAQELHQKYLANKEKASTRAEKREEKENAKNHMITIAVLPEGSPEVDLPRYYAVEKTKNVKYKKKNGETVNKVEKKYKLVNPLTKQRNIAQRQGSKPIDLKRKDIDRVAVEHTTVRTIPLDKFVPADQKKAYTYNRKRIKYDERGVSPKDRPDKSAFDVKERGRPEILPKNVYHHQNKGSSKLMEKLGKLRNPRQPEETKEETHQEEEKDGYEPPRRGEPPAPPAPPKRGRPKKYQTAEEAKKAKTQMTVASNKRRRGEVRETEAMGQEDRPAPARPSPARPSPARPSPAGPSSARPSASANQELIDYYSKFLALRRLSQSRVHVDNAFGHYMDSLSDIIVYALLQRGYEPNDSNFSKLKNMPQPAEVTDDFKKEMNIAFTAKTEQVKVKKGTAKQWFDEQKEKLRKMGVTAFDVKRDYDLRRLVGSGIIDSLKGVFNSVVGTVTDKAKQFGNTISQVITGSTDYSPSVRKILDDEGMNLIKSIVVGRTPVQKAITIALNVVSQGQFKSNQDRLNYDKLFHLFTEITLEDNKKVRVEKNEVITMTMGFKQDADTERQEVPMTKAVSFRDLLGNARRKMKGKFFAYDSANNNCQDFIMALLQGSGLGTQENYEFIKQNTKQLFEKIPRTRALAKQITNLGQRINIARSGGNISSNSIMPKFAKGSQEARDHMARIRAMRGCGRRKPKYDSDSDDEIVEMEMEGCGPKGLKKFNKWTGAIGDFLKPVAKPILEAGTKRTVQAIEGSGPKGLKKFNKWTGAIGDFLKPVAKPILEAGTKRIVSGIEGSGLPEEIERAKHMMGMGLPEEIARAKHMMGMGVHIHHHHYTPHSYAEGGNLGYGLSYSGYGPSGRGMEGAEYGHHHMAGSGPKGLKKFNKWTGAIGDFLKPVAKPILEAGTKRIVQGIEGSGPKGLKKFNKWTGAIGDFLKPVAKPILEAGTKRLVAGIEGSGTGKGSQAMKDKMARIRAMRG